MYRLPSQEGSGLKHHHIPAPSRQLLSSLARGKWIEAENGKPLKDETMSSLARGKWIEAFSAGECVPLPKSSLARGKWIEASGLGSYGIVSGVFPRKREVD